MSDCPKEENLRDADSATLSAAKGKEREKEGQNLCHFWGGLMCLAVMKEWNVVRLGSKSVVFFFFLWLYRFLVFQVKDFVEEFCI